MFLLCGPTCVRVIDFFYLVDDVFALFSGDFAYLFLLLVQGQTLIVTLINHCWSDNAHRYSMVGSVILRCV